MIPLRDINPTERFAVVTLILIIFNVIVFIYELALGNVAGEALAYAFALVPANLLTHAPRTAQTIPAVATLFTSMFLHGGLLHLTGNMLYLWIFGNNVEDAMGKIRFVIFSLFCGVAAASAHSLANRDSMIPKLGARGNLRGIGSLSASLSSGSGGNTRIFRFLHQDRGNISHGRARLLVRALVPKRPDRERFPRWRCLVCSCRRFHSRHFPDRPLQTERRPVLEREEI